MLNRRFIREKVIQSLYSYYQGGINDSVVCEKNMLQGLVKIYKLYIYNLSVIVAISDYFKDRFEMGKKKFIPTEDDLNPINTFPHNRVIEQIRHCPRFELPNSEYKFSWNQYEDLLKRMYNEITASVIYKEYIANPDSFENDKVFLQKVWKKKISTNPLFQSICEDASLEWVSDFDSVAYWVYLSIKKAEEENDNWIPDNFSKLGENESEDISFGKKLLEKTLLHDKEYEQMIVKHIENWESDRVAVIELIIIKAAVAEFINFPSIPVKVTLNEYIEISKRFCSEKSRIFVNGLLNKLCDELIANKMIKKTGRGLI